jgi:hypothetical protein
MNEAELLALGILILFGLALGVWIVCDIIGVGQGASDD